MIFFVGTDRPNHAKHLDNVCVSINSLARSREGYPPPRPKQSWILDSGAFTQITRHGAFKMSENDYARHIARYHIAGKSGLYGGPMVAAVSQDYMCADPALRATGCTVDQHNQMTVARYDRILASLRKRGTDAYLMPVLQGQSPEDYAQHLHMYGSRIGQGAWVGVGSVCKRNDKPDEVLEILCAIKESRPDLRLHGFGLKTTSLKNQAIVSMLHSSDSMAWSFAAMMEGRNNHDWREAKSFADRINQICQ